MIIFLSWDSFLFLTYFLCDTHKILRHWWYEHCMLLLISRTTALLAIFICLLMFCILPASGYSNSLGHYVPRILHVFIRSHTALYQRVGSNSHPDKAPFSLNKVIYTCLRLCQKDEIFITISLNFHSSEEFGVHLLADHLH